MGAGHAHRLCRHGHSPVHALPPHTELVAVLAFAVVAVSTPREAVWAFAGYAVLLGLVAYAARVPAGFLPERLLIEVPFVAFAVLLPFVAEDERADVLGLSLSVNGLWGAWNVLAKGTLGVAASVLLAATTELRELPLGLQRLRLPPRTGRHPALPGRHRPDGHARPALRPRTVPALADPERRSDRGGRPDRRPARRRRPAARAPPGAALRLRPALGTGRARPSVTMSA